MAGLSSNEHIRNLGKATQLFFCLANLQNAKFSTMFSLERLTAEHVSRIRNCSSTWFSPKFAVLRGS